MISIVIPLYNKAQSIASTIQCIRSQTYQDFEVVVVDGWSTDGSTEIIHQLAKDDARIRVLMQEDRHGVTPARNESIRAAKGERIAFIDADDYWEPTYLETLVHLMDDFPEAGIWGITYGEMQNGCKMENKDRVVGYRFRGIIDEPWEKVGCPYWTGATGISKTAFEKVGGFDNRIIYGEDIDLWYRIMLSFPCAFENTEKPLAYYRTDAENRACNHIFPLKIHLPYYIEKYAHDRAANADFRKFFDLQCLYRLFPYAGKREYKRDMRRILKQIDFSQQKKSMRLRFIFPRTYRFYLKMKGCSEKRLANYEGGSQEREV